MRSEPLGEEKISLKIVYREEFPQRRTVVGFKRRDRSARAFPISPRACQTPTAGRGVSYGCLRSVAVSPREKG